MSIKKGFPKFTVQSQTMEEWGPEHTREVTRIEQENKREVLRQWATKYWIEKAFRAGFKSSCSDVNEAFENFRKRNAIK